MSAATKPLLRVLRAQPKHWVGDGFPVSTAFTYQNAGRELSPFLMLDHGGPLQFEATDARRGVGEHPHRGFETVTVVYDGAVDHRDSSGGGGTIGPGDVQWMTAGSGVVHEEFHNADYARRGGPFHMVQLWVNLPAKDKMTPPRYQNVMKQQIPLVTLPSASKAGEPVGQVRLIAGDGWGQPGAAKTFTPLQVWDIALDANASALLPAQDGWGVGVLVLSGSIKTPSGAIAAGDMAVFQGQGSQVELQAGGSSTQLLWLSGQPIDEPIAGYGPFVMNTRDELVQAVEDFQAGRMGQLPAVLST